MRRDLIYQPGDLVNFKSDNQIERSIEWIVVKINEKGRTALIIPAFCVEDMMFIEGRIYFEGIGMNAELCRWVDLSVLDKKSIPELDSLHIRLLEPFDKNLILFEDEQERSKKVLAAFADYDRHQHYVLLEDTGGPRIVRIDYDIHTNWENEKKVMILEDLLKRYPYNFLVKQSQESIDRRQVLSTMSMLERNSSKKSIGEHRSGDTTNTLHVDEDDLILFGQYDNRDLCWRVLKKNEDKLYLLDENGIIYSPYMYEEDYDDCRWENSPIRSFLNNEFFNQAFSETEKKHIINVCTEKKTKIFPAVYDKVFLMSAAECRYLLPLERDRMLVEILDDHRDDSRKYRGVSWWLRSPGYEDGFCCSVNKEGKIKCDTGGHIDCVIRPSIIIDLYGSEIKVIKDKHS